MNTFDEFRRRGKKSTNQVFNIVWGNMLQIFFPATVDVDCDVLCIVVCCVIVGCVVVSNAVCGFQLSILVS